MQDFTRFIIFITISLIIVPLYLASECCKFIFWVINHPEVKLFLEANIDELQVWFQDLGYLWHNIRVWISAVTVSPVVITEEYFQ